MKTRILSDLPVLVILITIYIIFIPWAVGQYSYILIRESFPTYIQIGKLEKLTKKYQDIYALNYLARLQIADRRPLALERTIKLIEQNIPYYQKLGYKKIVLAILKKDYSKVIQLGLSFQHHDPYFEPVIELLMDLSIQLDYPILFRRELELLTIRAVFERGLVSDTNDRNISVKFADYAKPLYFVRNSDGVTIHWDTKTSDRFFIQAQKDHTTKRYFGSIKVKVAQELNRLEEKI